MPDAYDLGGIAATLERTPSTLRALLTGLSDEAIHATEGGDSWSPFDVVGHLIHGERTDWITRLRLILDQGESRPFEPFDRFAQFEASKERSLEELLDEFEELRAANLDTLATLLAGGVDLYATGTHPDLGRVTAGELLSTWAAHDLGHIAQVARVLARRFGSAVGPWKSYLPVLGAGQAG